MWCVLRSGAHIPASIRSLIKLPSVRLFHSTTFHSPASPLGFRLSLPNLDTSHRLLAARVRRSRQRPPQSSCSPPCAGPRGTTTRERRLSHCLGRLRLLLAGWRSVLRNPSCGGLCRSYWPAVRTDGGATGVWRGVSVWKNSGALDVEPGSTWSVLDDLGLFQYHKLTRKRVV